ncbi:MAG: hypothetical protein Q9192_001945 [Flavoplaca navasiana]
MKTRASEKRDADSTATARGGPRKSVRIGNGKQAIYKFRTTRARRSKSRKLDARSYGTLKTRETHPEDYPDLDFHHSFGSFLTRKNPVSKDTHPEIARYWDLLGNSPSLLQRHIHQIADKYRNAFRDFFVADPVSLHGHVSDASNVALLTSVISHLVSHASSDIGTPFFGDESKSNPRIAIAADSYGAGYGCLAYNAVLVSNRLVANGPRPVIITMTNPAQIDAQIRHAKTQRCVALIVELVCAGSGKVITENAWKHILNACEKYALILIVDEALTSIRCGAPFAYQLPQLARHGYPDLVLFGKAARTNGIAVEWRGINIKKLGIRDDGRLFTILDWQERVTEMAQAADLLISWGTLLLARREQWPQRAQVIGDILRGRIIAKGVKACSIRGLHSLIYIPLQDVGRLGPPVMGARAGRFLRWLPAMDEVMTSEEELSTKVFGEGSILHRREISTYLESQGLKLGFCSRCGDAVEMEVVNCKTWEISKNSRMLKIWSMKQQQQKADHAEGGGQKKKKVTAAQLRVQKDLSELSLGGTMKTKFPNPDDILNFTLTIEPDEGMYKGGAFHFNFAINQNFPHDPPKVKCTQKIYHPNIDLEGNVCLNILREDWKPVLNLNAVIVGLQFLFLEPNASDPLNKEAAEDLRTNRDGFKRNVRTSMGGGSVRGESYERVMK